MILYFVLVGFVTGTVAAVSVFVAGGGFLLALLAYSFGGAVGVVISALAAAFLPKLKRTEQTHSPTLPLEVRTVRARAASGARPVRGRPADRSARTARLHAHAPRR